MKIQNDRVYDTILIFRGFRLVGASKPHRLRSARVAQGNDGVGSGNGSVPPGLLQPRSDCGLA